MANNDNYGKIKKAILQNPKTHPYDIAGLLGLEQSKRVVNSIAVSRNSLQKKFPELLPKLPRKKPTPSAGAAPRTNPNAAAARRAILHFPHLSKEELREIIELVERRTVSQTTISRHRRDMI